MVHQHWHSSFFVYNASSHLNPQTRANKAGIALGVSPGFSPSMYTLTNTLNFLMRLQKQTHTCNSQCLVFQLTRGLYSFF